MRVCVCMNVCVCHIFKSSFISYSLMNISSPNLQRMFMAVKTCLKIMALILKSNIADGLKIIDMFKFKIFQLAVSDLHKM